MQVTDEIIPAAPPLHAIALLSAVVEHDPGSRQVRLKEPPAVAAYKRDHAGVIDSGDLADELGIERKYVRNRAVALDVGFVVPGLTAGRPVRFFAPEQADVLRERLRGGRRARYQRDADVAATLKAKRDLRDTNDLAAELGIRTGQVSAYARQEPEQGFTVDGLSRRRFFTDGQAAEIRARHLRSNEHPPPPVKLKVCGNSFCTQGPDGGRVQMLVYASRLDRLTRYPWTCSNQCRQQAMAGGRHCHRSIRRKCVCEGCEGVVWITKRQEASGKGPRRCDDCKAANRPTPAQLAGRPLSPDLRDRFVAAGADTAQRTSRSPDRMDKLIAARMKAHQARKQALRERVSAALIASPSESNTAIASRLHCGYYAITSVRCDLEEAGMIPYRNGEPQTRPPSKYVAPCEYTEELKKRVRGTATSRAIAAGNKGAARRAARDELDARIVAELEAVSESDAARRVKVVADKLNVPERRVQRGARRQGRPPVSRGGRPRKQT